MATQPVEIGLGRLQLQEGARPAAHGSEGEVGAADGGLLPFRQHAHRRTIAEAGAKQGLHQGLEARGEQAFEARPLAVDAGIRRPVGPNVRGIVREDVKKLLHSPLLPK